MTSRSTPSTRNLSITPWMLICSSILVLTGTIGVFVGKFDSAKTDLLISAVLGSVMVGVFALVRSNARPPVIDMFAVFLMVSLLHHAVVPLLNVYLGAPTLPNRGNSSTGGAADASFSSLAFGLSICLGWWFCRVNERNVRTSVERPLGSASQRTIVALFVLGMIGLVIRFPSPGALLAFLRGDYTAVVEGPQGIVGFASSALRPMLALATFLSLRKKKSLLSCLPLLPAVLLSLIALLSFSLNRASLLITVCAMAFVYVRDRPHTAMRLLASLALIGGMAFLAIGGFRSELVVTEGGRYDVPVQQQSDFDRIYTSISVYGQSPFLTGIIEDWPEGLGETPSGVGASLVSPIPRMGESYRSESGTSLYNRKLYSTAVQDQILAVWAELKAAIGWGGMVLGGFLIGSILCWLDRRIALARGTVTAYALTLLGIWIAQVSIVSIQILSQIVIFFVLPALAVGRLLEQRSAADRPRSRSMAAAQQIAP